MHTSSSTRLSIGHHLFTSLYVCVYVCVYLYVYLFVALLDFLSSYSLSLFRSVCSRLGSCSVIFKMASSYEAFLRDRFPQLHDVIKEHADIINHEIISLSTESKKHKSPVFLFIINLPVVLTVVLLHEQSRMSLPLCLSLPLPLIHVHIYVSYLV